MVHKERVAPFLWNKSYGTSMASIIDMPSMHRPVYLELPSAESVYNRWGIIFKMFVMCETFLLMDTMKTRKEIFYWNNYYLSKIFYFNVVIFFISFLWDFVYFIRNTFRVFLHCNQLAFSNFRMIFSTSSTIYPTSVSYIYLSKRNIYNPVRVVQEEFFPVPVGLFYNILDFFCC